MHNLSNNLYPCAFCIKENCEQKVCICFHCFSTLSIDIYDLIQSTNERVSRKECIACNIQRNILVNLGVCNICYNLKIKNIKYILEMLNNIKQLGLITQYREIMFNGYSNNDSSNDDSIDNSSNDNSSNDNSSNDNSSNDDSSNDNSSNDDSSNDSGSDNSSNDNSSNDSGSE